MLLDSIHSILEISFVEVRRTIFNCVKIVTNRYRKFLKTHEKQDRIESPVELSSCHIQASLLQGMMDMGQHKKKSDALDIAKEISHHRNAIASPTQQCLLTCYIPPSRVGAVIGRRGNTILQIQKEAMKKSWGPIRLSIVSGANDNSNSSENNSYDNAASESEHHANSNEFEKGSSEKAQDADIDEELWTPVMIRGDPNGIFAAARMLIPLLHTGPSDAIEYDASSDMDDVVLDIPIHRSKHSAIIGKKGSTIANLSADNNVRIMVPHRNMEKTTSGSINIVQLEGELFNVEQCLAHMLKVVCSPPPSLSATNKSNSSHTAHGEEVLSSDGRGIIIELTSKKESKFSEKTITVPPELYHLVPSLGRIRIIGKSTNTVIRRKKLTEASEDLVEMENEEGDESDKSDSQKNKNISSPCVTLLIVSGKSRPVENATLQLQRTFSPTSESDDEKEGVETDTKSEISQQQRRGRGKNRYGRGRGGRGSKNKK